MTRRASFRALLQLVLCGVAASREYSECSESGISMEVSGVLEELELSDEQRIIIVESSKEVNVECRADSPVQLVTGFEKTLPTNNSKSELKVKRVLWKENETNFWSSKNVTCLTDSAACTFNLTLANKADSVTNCTYLDDEFVCNVRDWYEEVQKDRSSGQCVGKNQKPLYDFFVYNHQSHNWTKCAKAGVGIEQSFDNVSQIVCEGGQAQVQKSDKLIIRLRKKFMSKSLFISKVACEESTYLALSGDYFAAGEEEEDGDIAYVTTGAIILLSIAFISVTIVCCVRQIKHQRQHQPIITYSKSSNYFKRSNGDFFKQGDFDKNGELDGYLDVSGSGITIVIDPPEEEKDAYNHLLDGNLSELNPAMLVNKQTRVLQYDRSFEISRDNFQLEFIIGEGQYGTVYRATARGINGANNLTKVAVKQVKNILDETQWMTILDELKILSYLEVHFNLVNLVAANTASMVRHELFLLLEYCPFGDMKTFLMDKKEEFMGSLNNEPGHLETEFNWNLMMTWSYSIACGMNYLASKKIMHGDLAARNVLIGENYSAKISDFGLSKMMYYNEDYKKTERRLIPWAWMAVEYLQTGEFNLMSDVWSFGVTLWEIFSIGHKPYGLESYEDMKVRILEGERLQPPKPLELHCDGQTFYQQVMVPCWKESPSSRPQFSQLIEWIGEFLGSNGVAAYKADEMKYLKSRLNPEEEPKSSPAPAGYIRVESIDGSKEESQTSKENTSSFQYVEVKPKLIQEKKVHEVSSEPGPGYSRAGLSPKGYIELAQVNQS